MALQHAIGDLENGGSIFNKSYQIIGYADDLAIMANTYRSMVEVFVALESRAKQVGLKINENKTKYMRMSRNTRVRSPQNITIADFNFEGVENFKYLGILLRNDNSMHHCVQDRIRAGNACYFAHKKLLQSKLLSKKLKTSLYKTIIRPIVTYGCEVWSLTTTDEKNLRIFERKIIRKIYGARLENGIYIRRTNEEINAILEDEDIVRFAKAQRIRWLGHLVRMDDSRKQKRTFNGNPESTRTRGRPRIRWIDGVTNDIQKLNVQNWRNAAQDRTEWRQIVQKAKSYPRM